jgi:acetylornithine/N-succinyldiaminopimelate aminotransferase
MPISEQIQSLVKTYLDDCSEITKICGPKSEKADVLESSAISIEASRGRPLFFKYVGSGRGQGPYVELEDGSVKLDLINGIGIHVLGHSHPKILEKTVTASLSDAVMQGNLQPNKEYKEILDKLTEISSRHSKLKHAWLSPSGAMANENALKMCRQKTNGARMVISFNNAFAGRTTMMAELTDNDSYRQGLPRYNDVLRIPFYDSKNPNSTEESLEAFKKHVEEHRGNICAFMFEPMQGEGGYRVAPREFFIPMLEICKKEGIPVFLDEVQTFCRTGYFFAFETLCIAEYVDVVSVAKTLQNGATFYTEDFNPKAGLISGTFAGSTVALAAGLQVLEELDQGYMGPEGKIQKIHNSFTGMLKDLNETTCKGMINEVEGLGLMIAFTPFDGSKEKMLELVKHLFKNGVMGFGCGSGPYRMRFLLPAILTDQHISEIKAVLEKTLLEMNG